jgi:mannose-6-phosphate isomerase-like protein (cupin superfamily)
MCFRLGRFGRRTILAHPGDTVLVAAGTAHWFGNVGAGVARARGSAAGPAHGRAVRISRGHGAGKALPRRAAAPAF